MPVTVTVSTPDRTPTSAPYKISTKAGKQQATITMNVTAGEPFKLGTAKLGERSLGSGSPGPVRAWFVRRGGNSVVTGTPLRSGGVVCGLTKCGTSKALALPNPAVINTDVQASELSTEGTNIVGIYVYNGDVME